MNIPLGDASLLPGARYWPEVRVRTRALLDHHPDLPSYLGQMAALDLILVALAALLFETVLVGAGPNLSRKPAREGRPGRR